MRFHFYRQHFQQIRNFMIIGTLPIAAFTGTYQTKIQKEVLILSHRVGCMSLGFY